MANELNILATARLVNGSHREQFDIGNALQIDQASQGAVSGIVTIGTSEEDLDLSELATPRWAFFRNLDSTNFVTIGPKSAGAMVAMLKLLPGEIALMPLAGSVTLRAIADTASVKLQRMILES